MGCDIHFYVERRDGDKWVSCDEWVNEYDYWEVPYEKQFYTQRNYDLFAILADVRNGRGFGGESTGEGFIPLAAPRGLPHDLSMEVKRHTDKCLEHTPSWCTVAELLEYDWTRETLKRGILDLSEYLRWRPWYANYREWPKSWSGGISGPGIVIWQASDVEAKLKDMDAWAISHRKLDPEVAARLGVDLNEVTQKIGHFHDGRVHVEAQWGATYARCAKEFLSETMPRLWRLGKPEDVRCVFYFDS
jgi:hypothetical protein